jgi:hypothetical protein
VALADVRNLVIVDNTPKWSSQATSEL